jgi:hypothetical protein
MSQPSWRKLGRNQSRRSPSSEKRSGKFSAESRKYHDKTPYSRPKYLEEASRRAEFTELTKTPKEILATEDARFSIRPPKALPKNRGDRSKYCEFHCNRGHHTHDCIQLKKQIEDAVQSGELLHLVKNIKDKRRPDGKKEKKEEKVFMVEVGTPREKRRTSTLRRREVISHPPLTRGCSSSSPMVIKANVEGQLVHRVYLDGGSASEIIYEHNFKKLREETM